MSTKSSRSSHQPLVSSDRSLAEITVKGLLLGAALSMILAAANAYIGLLVGLTVSASIPAAAVSMGVLRIFRKSNILENNLVQTAASAGESLVAGIIFTVPALVMMGAWKEYDYIPLVAIGILGGVLGVAFTVPLRRALIVESDLKFPEGVATAEVLKTGGIETDRSDHHGKHAHEQGQEAASGFTTLLQAAGIGAVFKLFQSGMGWFSDSVAASGVWLKGKILWTGDITLSPALVAVGHIVGLNIATLIFAGGMMGTLIGVPLNWAFRSEDILIAAGMDPQSAWSSLDHAQWTKLAEQSWQDCRRIGVGAMIVGGVWSLISLAKPLAAGVRASLEAYRQSRSGHREKVLRTELDTPINIVGVVVLLTTVPLFAVFMYALDGYENRLWISLLMTIMMIGFGFLFSSVAGYMAGLVGSSNNPISGVTIATVIVAALILLQIMGNDGVAGRLGPVAVIYLAALICSSAAIAGDNMQDLKCGHIVGATPWRQQVYQIVGVVSAAFAIPWILQILDAGQGIGRAVQDNIAPLAAPQAALMQSLASGIFGAGINWRFIFMGFVLAILLIILDKIQESRGSSFRFPVLAVAVGVYLPLGLSVPIYAGGILAAKLKRNSAKAPEETRQRQENTGLLLASGLITGEALMGVAVAVAAVVLSNMDSSLPSAIGVAPWLGSLALFATTIYLYRRTSRA